MYIATTSFVREDGRLAIYAYMQTGHEVRLFAYYSDELSFNLSDFIGKTVQEARDLFMWRDGAYLRS
jgi:midasin (ATPase involved in ribosome maturation)